MGLTNLPPEIVGEIAAHLSSRKDLCSFAQVNRQLYVTHILRRAIINSQNFAGLTFLAQASKSGNQDAVASWLQEAPDVNLPDSLGRTALSWASGFGHKDIVQWLLESGANANMSDGFRRTALSWAAEKGHYNVVELLVKSGAKVQIHGLPTIRKLDNAARKSHPNLSGQFRQILSRKFTPQDTRRSTRNRYVLHNLLRHELCCIDLLSLAKKNGHEKTIYFLQQISVRAIYS